MVTNKWLSPCDLSDVLSSSSKNNLKSFPVLYTCIMEKTEAQKVHFEIGSSEGEEICDATDWLRFASICRSPISKLFPSLLAAK